MADDRYSSKRQYDDPSPPPRRTGFSSGPPPASPPAGDAPSYNSVPPPPDEIQLRKQRAHEIAARIFNAAEAKRPRVDNGHDEVVGYGGGGLAMLVRDYLHSLEGVKVRARIFNAAEAKRPRVDNGHDEVVGYGGGGLATLVRDYLHSLEEKFRNNAVKQFSHHFHPYCNASTAESIKFRVEEIWPKEILSKALEDICLEKGYQ